MIAVHRISQPDHELLVNPDLIQFVEANPDTVITLANGTRLVVIEAPWEIAEHVRAWRTSILTSAEQPLVVPERRAAVGRIAGVVPFPQHNHHAD